MQPTVGRIVHYVSYGTPGGEYPSVCRAAIITAVGEPLADNVARVDLAVLNPEGMFFNRSCAYHDGAVAEGAADCPNPEAHGGPFRYCACGWIEASHQGGTWHWPERD